MTLRSTIVPLILVASLAPKPVAADRLTIDTDREWNEWTLPGNAVEVSRGTLTPAFIRRDIDAVAGALYFGGGIRDVGTDARNAGNLIDGDSGTSWSPDSADPVEDWWIEVDLGRVVSARTLRLFFDTDGAALEFFKILTSDGEPFFNVSRTTIEGTLRYNNEFRFSFNDEHVIEIDLDLKPLHYMRIEAKLKTADIHLSRLEVETVGDNLSLNLRDRGGDISIIARYGDKKGQRSESSGLSGVLVDGDLSSTWGLVFTGVAEQSFPEEIFGRFWIDLGALFWVDRVRILGDASGIAPGPGTRERERAFNYLWYRLRGSDGSLAPDGNSLLWTVIGELPPDQKNLKEVVRFQEQFELQKLRFFELIFPMSNQLAEVNGRIGTTAELQIFGEGYTAEIVAFSPLYDLRGLKNISSLAWSADVPAGTRVEIRSRTGNLLKESLVYHDKDGAEVTEAKYNKLISSFKGAIDTLKSPGSDWSTWSNVYEPEDEVFFSPSPRQFVQLELRMVADDPFSAASVNSISLTFDEPLAQQTFGEVFPAEATPGELTEFTYFLSSSISNSSVGFDHVLITSPASTEYRGLRLDGERLDPVVELVDEGFLISLERPVRRSGTLEIDFSSTVFLNQTRFDAFLVEGSGAAAIRQQVDAGDANPDIDSEAISVSLPAGRKIIDNLTFSSRIFTPNGDDVDDRLEVTFDLFRVNVPRPLTIGVYDLSGRQRHVLDLVDVTAGPQRVEWDGLDAGGKLLPPGNYLLRLRFEGDAQSETIDRAIAIAY